MARKKADTFQEEPDEAAIEAEVMDSDGGTGEGENVEVTLTDPKKPPAAEPQLSETTKAEQEAGRKTLEERQKSKQAETNEEAS